MKKALILTLALVSSASAFAAPCDLGLVPTLESEIKPSLSLNQEIVLNLLEGATLQQYQCDQTVLPGVAAVWQHAGFRSAWLQSSSRSQRHLSSGI